MKKVMMIALPFSLSLFFCNNTQSSSTNTDVIILPTASMCDNRFIKEEDIGHIYKLGTRVNQILSEPYKVGTKSYTIAQLIDLEQTGKLLLADLQTTLKQIKTVFIKASSDCLAAAHGSKAQFIPLIREWAHTRNKTTSQLLKWSETEEFQEHEHFNKTVTTFEKFHEFCLDLLVFLSDIINSCPKAHQLFKKRMEKLHIIHTLLPKIATVTPQEEKQFINFIMKNHLADKVTTLTIDTIKELWNEFRKTR